MGALQPLTGSLKRSVTARLVSEFGDRLPRSLFRRALDEAETAAHSSGYPNLFFPELAEEKMRLVSAAVAPDSQGRSPLRHAA
jgi:hypothetical protein